jgi:hypothetical protein
MVVFVGIALFLVACAARETTRRVGLLFCALAFAGAGVARFAGILEFQAVEFKQVVTASLEITFSVITLFLYRQWPAAQQTAEADGRGLRPSERPCSKHSW